MQLLMFRYLCIVLMLIGCSDKPSLQREFIDTSMSAKFVPVTFGEILANPDKFHSKQIEIEGYYEGGVEKSALFKSRHAGNLKKAMWIEIGSRELKDSASGEKLGQSQEQSNIGNERYVRVRGIFDKNNTGHMDDYFGGIDVWYFKIL